jgi:hypothetical protein
MKLDEPEISATSEIWAIATILPGCEVDWLPARRALPISPQHVTWMMLKASPSKHRYLQALYNASTQVAAVARTANNSLRSFVHEMQQRGRAGSRKHFFCATTEAGPGRCGSRVTVAMEQRHGGGSYSPGGTSKAANVRPRRFRPA